MRFLAIAAQNPSPRASQAGHKIAFKFLQELAARGEVDVILLINQDDAVDREALTKIGVNIVLVKRFSRARKISSILINFMRIPPRFCTRYLHSISSFIERQCAEKSYDEVHFEFSQSLPYLDRCQKVLTCVSIHDVQLQVVLRSGWLERTFFSAATYRYERDLLKKASKVYLLCDKDRDLVRSLFNVTNTEVRSPPIDGRYGLIVRTPKTIEPYSMIFWGAMDRKENIQAALYFIRNIMPLILSRFEDAKLYIVGNNPPRHLQRLASKNVVVTGFVEDPMPYFQKAHVGVVPLLRGAGIKIKTLEMLAAGLCVISTEVGAEGVNSSKKLKVVDLDKFGERIIEVMSKEIELNHGMNREKRKEMNDRG